MIHGTPVRQSPQAQIQQGDCILCRISWLKGLLQAVFHMLQESFTVIVACSVLCMAKENLKSTQAYHTRNCSKLLPQTCCLVSPLD